MISEAHRTPMPDSGKWSRVARVNLLLAISAIMAFTGSHLWGMERQHYQVYVTGFVLMAGSVLAAWQALNTGWEDYRKKKAFEQLWNEAGGPNSARFLSDEDLERLGCFEGGRLLGVTFSGRLIYAPKNLPESHSAIFAANGGGKTSCGGVPLILSIAHQMAAGKKVSILVNDPKDGEVFAQVAPVLDRLGIPYVVVDNWNVFRKHRAAVHLNPFAMLHRIRKSDPASAEEYIEAIAAALCPMPEHVSHQEYWYLEPQIRLVIAIKVGLILYGDRLEPGHVWAIFNSPEQFAKALEIAAKQGNEALRGQALKVMQYMANKQPHEPSHVGKALACVSAFSSSGWLHELVPSKPTKPIFTHDKLMTGPMVVFIVGRSDSSGQAKSYFALELQAFLRAQLTMPFWETHYFADEAANTPLQELTGRIQTVRAKGARLTLVFQSVPGMEKAFGRTGAKIIANESVVKQYFSFSDPEEAARISAAIGQKIVIKPSVSASSSRSDYSGTWSVSREPQMSQERLMSLPMNQQLIHFRGAGWVHALKVHQSEIDPYAQWLGRNPVEDHDAVVNIKYQL